MKYTKPHVERAVCDTGYAEGWVVVVDRGGRFPECFPFDTWREAFVFALAWTRVMSDVLA